MFLQGFIDGISVPANIPVRSVPTGMSARTHPSAKTCKSTKCFIDLLDMIGRRWHNSTQGSGPYAGEMTLQPHRAWPSPGREWFPATVKFVCQTVTVSADENREVYEMPEITDMHSSAAQRTRCLRVILGMVAAGIVIFQLWYFSIFTVDDAYISYRYAENFANGLGLVFNPGEYVEGYTNFLWVVLLAFFNTIGITTRTASLTLGGVASLLTLAVTYWFSCDIARQPTAFGLLNDSEQGRLGTTLAQPSAPSAAWWACFDMVAVLLLAACPAFGLWAVAGLETPLFTCVLTSAIWRHCREQNARSIGSGQRRGVPIAALLFGIATLIRPEGALYFALTLIASLSGFGFNESGQKKCITAFRDGMNRWRPELVKGGKAVLGFVAIVGPHIAWRWIYYDSLLPNTFYVKVGDDFSLSGVKYVFQFFLSYGGLVGFLLCAGLLLVRRSEEYWVKYGLLLLGIHSLYVIYVGGDWMPAFRYFVPLLPLYFLGLQEGIRELIRWVGDCSRLRKIQDTAASGQRFPKIPGVLVVLFTFLLLNIGWLWWQTPRIDTRLDGHVQIGHFLRGHAAPHDVLAAIDIGAMAYFSGLHTIDYFGLTDRHIARRPPRAYTFETEFWGHRRFRLKTDIEYVLSQMPTFIELNTLNAPQDTAETDPADPLSALMLRSRRFRQGYRPFYHAGGTTIFKRVAAQRPARCGDERMPHNAALFP